MRATVDVPKGAPRRLPDAARKRGEKGAVAEARSVTHRAAAPHSCKYTEEGTVAHLLMQRIAKVDRRMKGVSEIEITLSAADKAQLEAEYKEEVLKEIASLEAEGLKDLSPDLSALPKAPDTMRIA